MISKAIQYHRIVQVSNLFCLFAYDQEAQQGPARDSKVADNYLDNIIYLKGNLKI